MPAEAAVLTAEFKINLLNPRWRAVSLSRRCAEAGSDADHLEARADAIKGGWEKLVATMTATLMALVGRTGVTD